MKEIFKGFLAFFALLIVALSTAALIIFTEDVIIGLLVIAALIMVTRWVTSLNE
jgi:hypothetical protein